MTDSRIAGNTAATGSGIDQNLGNGATTMSATDVWWGCNTGPSAAPCDTATDEDTGSGDVFTTSPWVELKTSGSPGVMNVGGSSSLTASFLKDSAGNALTATQIAPLLGLPVTWSGVHGSISTQQSTIQSNGQATASFSQDGSCNTSGGEAKVDGVPNGDLLATASFSQPTTLRCPNLAVTKTNDATGSMTTIGQPWDWTVHVSNGATGYAMFTNGQTILSDNLPSSHATYGAVSVTPNGGVSGTISCGIVSNNLACTANGTVVINGSDNAPAGTVDVKFSVTPSAAGLFANPRSGGSCAVDPSNAAGEDPLEVNACSNSVTVDAVTDLLVTDVGSPAPIVVAGSLGGVDNLMHTITLTNNGPDDNAGAAVAVTFGSGLPSGTTLDTATPSVGTYDTNTNVWSVPSLANGASATLQLKFNVTGSTADSTTVTTSATGSVTDPFAVEPDNTNDETASASTTVHQPPKVSPNPSLKAFADQQVGSTSGAQTFTITNTGGCR